LLGQCLAQIIIKVVMVVTHIWLENPAKKLVFLKKIAHLMENRIKFVKKSASIKNYGKLKIMDMLVKSIMDLPTRKI